MAEQVGDVVKAPAYTHYAYSTDDELLYSTVGLVQKGVTLAPNKGVLPVGTVLARNSSTKLFEPWNSGGSSATNLPVGLLRTAVDTGTNGGSGGTPQLGNIVLSGKVKSSKIALGTGSALFIPYPTTCGTAGVITLAQVAAALDGKLDAAAASGAYGTGTGAAFGVFSF